MADVLPELGGLLLTAITAIKSFETGTNDQIIADEDLIGQPCRMDTVHSSGLAITCRYVSYVSTILAIPEIDHRQRLRYIRRANDLLARTLNLSRALIVNQNLVPDTFGSRDVDTRVSNVVDDFGDSLVVIINTVRDLIATCLEDAGFEAVFIYLSNAITLEENLLDLFEKNPREQTIRQNLFEDILELSLHFIIDTLFCLERNLNNIPEETVCQTAATVVELFDANLTESRMVAANTQLSDDQIFGELSVLQDNLEVAVNKALAKNGIDCDSQCSKPTKLRRISKNR